MWRFGSKSIRARFINMRKFCTKNTPKDTIKDSAKELPKEAPKNTPKQTPKVEEFSHYPKYANLCYSLSMIGMGLAIYQISTVYGKISDLDAEFNKSPRIEDYYIQLPKINLKIDKNGGLDEWKEDNEFIKVVMAPGESSTKEELVNRFKPYIMNFRNAVNHPTLLVSSLTNIGAAGLGFFFINRYRWRNKSTAVFFIRLLFSFGFATILTMPGTIYMWNLYPAVRMLDENLIDKVLNYVEVQPHPNDVDKKHNF